MKTFNKRICGTLAIGVAATLMISGLSYGATAINEHRTLLPEYPGALEATEQEVNEGVLADDDGIRCYEPRETYEILEPTLVSPDGQRDFTIVNEGYPFDSVLIREGGTETVVPLIDILYSAVFEYSWLDNDRMVILGHRNPSLDVNIVVDANTKEIIGEYYGLGFTWNEDQTKLYYVEKGPHYSQEFVSDKIVDDTGHVYYESEYGYKITDEISISGDEQNFAFFVNGTLEGQSLLLAGELDNRQAINVYLEKSVAFGDINFVTDNSLEITTLEGSSLYIDVKNSNAPEPEEELTLEEAEALATAQEPALSAYDDLMNSFTHSRSTGEIVYPATYSGCYINEDSKLVICTTDLTIVVDVMSGNPNVVYKKCDFSYNELNSIMDTLNDIKLEDTDNEIMSQCNAFSLSQTENRVVVALDNYSEEAIAEFRANIIDSDAIIFEQGYGPAKLY